MFRTLIARELRAIFASPRFVAVFAVTAVLVLLSLATGYVQVRAFEREQTALAGLTEQEMAEQTRWFSLRPRALRQADALAIVATGIHHDVGRYTVIRPDAPVALRSSVFEDDPILAVFRDLDLVDILQLVITLYALLLTYDAVSGERESGVLRLVAAQPLPRWRYLAAKVIGNLVGLGLPLAVILLCGWLGLLALGVPLSGAAGARFALLLAGGGLLFAFFVTFGVMVSSLTRRPTTSFLAALTAWIALVLVIPRLGLLVAGELSPVPSAAEVDSQRAGFERETTAASERAMEARWAARRREVQAQPEATRRQYEDDRTWGWLEEDDQFRRDALAAVDARAAKLDEQVRNLRRRQERLALGFAAWTPSAAFRAAALHLAGTHVELLPENRAAMDAYREDVRRYLLEKDPSAGAILVRADDRGGEIRRGDEGTRPLDLADLPRFAPPAIDLGRAAGAALPHFAVLLASWLGAFGVASLAFARYDAR
ncbi:MAG: ABC transporter permease subunit [Thermoanaerobaculia bacterium]